MIGQVNDDCSGAIGLSCNETISGTTTGATADNAGFCGTSNTSPGVWYKFEGTGGNATLSTCNDANYDTKISVFSGECGTLTCVGGNDDSTGCSGFTSEYDFLTVLGTNYYVLVHGFSAATGNFDLTLTCTVPPTPPSNDTCLTAETISCGDVKTGDTTLATNDSSLPFCGTTLTSGPGVWYEFVGTGDEIFVTVDTNGSDFDTKLGVFTGECGALTCVDGDDDGGDGLQSELSFTSEVNTAYYIYVTGFLSASGEYTLSLGCELQASIEEDCATVYYGYAPTQCTDLTVNVAYGVPPYTIEWSTGDTDTNTINVCPTETTTYSVTVTDAEGTSITDETTVVFVDVSCGNSNNGKVLICHKTGSESNPYNTLCIAPSAVQSHLDHGDLLGECGSLSCDTAPACDIVLTSPLNGAVDVVETNPISWSVASGYVEGYTITIGTTSGGSDIVNNEDVGNTTSYSPENLGFLTTYYVTISAYNANGIAEGCAESSFTTQDIPVPDNDTCEGALPIVCGDVLNGDTTYASNEPSLPFCGTTLTVGPGVWYKYEGNGEYISATVTTAGSDYDTKLAVFTGSCGSFTCVGGNDDGGPGFTSQLEFDTEDGESYYIYVTGFSSASGLYTLSLECIEAPTPPTNDTCETALPIVCGDVLNGDTTLATNDASLPFCGTSLTSGRGVWYKYEGNGEYISASVTTAGSTFDTKLGVFTGTCGSFTCVGGDDDGGPGTTSSLNFETVDGVSYYIYVTGYSSSSAGLYTLSLECIEAPNFDVVCGETNSGTYCYGNNDTTEFTYTSTNGSPLQVVFNSGNVENTYDELIILDSDGTTQLYNGYGNSGDLAGLSFTSTGDNITIKISSDFSVSCESSSSINPWNYDVTCADGGRMAGPEFTVYPNPSKTSTVHLDLRDYLNQDLNIQVLDVRGNVINREELLNLSQPTHTMQLNNAVNGMYFVRVQTNRGVTTKKLIIAY
jgi:hypothetical protein